MFEIVDGDDVEYMLSTFEQQMSSTVLKLNVDSGSIESSSNVPRTKVPGDDDGDEDDEDWVSIYSSMESMDEEDEDHTSDCNSTYSDSEGDGTNLLQSPVFVVSPISSALHGQHPTHIQGTPFWKESPHYNYIDWDHQDLETENFPRLDIPGSWHTGDKLYIGLRFDSKEVLKLALKHYSMQSHQSHVTFESKPSILYVKCPNIRQEPGLRMITVLGKKSNKWQITKWGGYILV